MQWRPLSNHFIECVALQMLTSSLPEILGYLHAALISLSPAPFQERTAPFQDEMEAHVQIELLPG